MNQKTAKLLRKQVREYLRSRDKSLPERLLVVAKSKTKIVELPNAPVNEDGTVKSIEYTVYTAANSKDSVRGHYRALKKHYKKSMKEQRA